MLQHPWLVRHGPRGELSGASAQQPPQHPAAGGIPQSLAPSPLHPGLAKSAQREILEASPRAASEHSLMRNPARSAADGVGWSMLHTSLNADAGGPESRPQDPTSALRQPEEGNQRAKGGKAAPEAIELCSMSTSAAQSSIHASRHASLPEEGGSASHLYTSEVRDSPLTCLFENLENKKSGAGPTAVTALHLPASEGQEDLMEWLPQEPAASPSGTKHSRRAMMPAPVPLPSFKRDAASASLHDGI